MCSNDTFYFIIYTDNNTAIKVIDLANCVDYERSEFPVVNNENFNHVDDAIKYAKLLAEAHDLGYQPFKSRYNSELDETLTLNL